MSSSQFRITWSDTSVLESLAGLQKDSAQYRVLSRGVRSYASVVNKEVKSLVPKRSGLLQRSIGVKNLPRRVLRRKHFALSLVGPRVGYKASTNAHTGWSKRPRLSDPAKYAHLLDGGTVQHKISGVRRNARNGRLYRFSVQHPGISASRFMDRALIRTRVPAGHAMARSMERALDSEAKRRSNSRG